MKRFKRTYLLKSGKMIQQIEASEKPENRAMMISEFIINEAGMIIG